MEVIKKGKELKDFKIDYDYLEHGIDDIYQHLDIDNDGIDDNVIRSCGASLDSICHLTIGLSSGKKLELNLPGERFFLIRIKSLLYLISGKATAFQKNVTDNNNKRVYQIDKDDIKLICNKI
ncbi:hypothetical protein [Methylomonas sp. MK1]|uniref:hypothetical protein n=1 Tax=Methylomonas sp. MK1 TaxID=1131552 RepID=UPI0003998939|nr:hypothetical protein [Methylomonas sp. MK1]